MMEIKAILYLFTLIILHQNNVLLPGVLSIPVDVIGEDQSDCTNDPTPKIRGEETTYNTLFIGQTVFVFCEYEACDSPATITWYRNTERLKFDENNVGINDDRLRLMENGSLIIERVQLKDTGVKYVCNVQTKNGRDTASAFLDVKSESKILGGPKDQAFQEGSDATFDCDFEIDDTLKDTSVIEWYKDGEKIDPYDLHTPTVINPEYDDGSMSVEVDESRNSQPRYILHHNNSLTIENVEDADVGSYTCKVDTGIGEPLVLEAGTLYTKESWWWIVIVVLIIIGALLLFTYLVMRYVQNHQKSGKYNVKINTKNNSKKDQPTVLHL